MKKIHAPEVVSIIGGKGKLGKKFKKSFEEKGLKVFVSDLDAKLSNMDVASKGDIVIVTVPINVTEKVLREVTPHVREGALLTDFTSVKMLPMEVMKNTSKSSKVEVAGGHPLFGPTTPFKNQSIILCKGVVGPRYVWYKKFLTSLGLHVLEMTPEEHDRHMAVIQCLTHFSNLSLGSALTKLRYNLEEGEKIATPIYKLRLYGVGRILAQDPVLYADIQNYNPFAKEMSEVYLQAVEELHDTVRKRDTNAFKTIFVKSQTYFGALKEKSLTITDKLINTMK